jgi:acetyl esterase
MNSILTRLFPYRNNDATEAGFIKPVRDHRLRRCNMPDDAAPGGARPAERPVFMAIECIEELMPVEAAQMPARVYRLGDTPRSAPIVLHLHGGAFVSGSPETGGMVARLLAGAGAIVVSAGYPLAPEHPFPKPLQASFAVLQSLKRCPARWASRKSGIYVAGEEAGGNLAASLALFARDQQTPLAGQILLSPMLDPCLATMSLRQVEAGMVGCKWADGWHKYLGSPDKACHPYAAPLGSSRLAGIAPALLITAEDDPLSDESVSYARRLAEAGVTAECHILNAPTGWPDALSHPENAEPAWAAKVREHFVGFFKRTTSLPWGRRP